jgi:hypothetical protein
VSGVDLGGIASLGAFHGVNPAMGWLLAVAIGAQDASRRRLLAALGPIAVGHLAAIALTLVLVVEAKLVVSETVVRIAGAAALAAFAAWKLARQRHPRWVGMRLSARDLVAWSFLMSSASGAGLMLIPFAVDAHAAGLGFVAAATAVHAAAMVAVAGVVAVAVYEVVGVGVLRRGWVNLDRAWAYVLAVGALVTLLG